MLSTRQDVVSALKVSELWQLGKLQCEWCTVSTKQGVVGLTFCERMLRKVLKDHESLLGRLERGEWPQAERAESCLSQRVTPRNLTSPLHTFLIWSL